MTRQGRIKVLDFGLAKVAGPQSEAPLETALQDDLVPRIVSTVADWYGALPHSMSEAVRFKAPDQPSSCEAGLLLSDMSATHDQEHLCEGTAEEIMDASRLDPSHRPSWEGLAEIHVLSAVYGLKPAADSYPAAEYQPFFVLTGLPGFDLLGNDPGSDDLLVSLRLPN